MIMVLGDRREKKRCSKEGRERSGNKRRKRKTWKRDGEGGEKKEEGEGGKRKEAYEKNVRKKRQDIENNEG